MKKFFFYLDSDFLFVGELNTLLVHVGVGDAQPTEDDEGLHEVLVCLGEADVRLVDQLHNTYDVTLAVSDGGAEHRLRTEAGLRRGQHVAGDLVQVHHLRAGGGLQ